MKKYINKASRFIAGSLVCLSMLAVPTSCDQIDEEFDNPDEMTEPRLDLFFAGALKKEHLFRLGYGPSYHHINAFARQMGLGANVGFSFSSYGNNKGVEYWNDWSGAVFYPHIFEKTSADYTLNINGMALLYEDMNQADKDTYEVFMLCARIVKSYAFQRATDMYDDIPYSEAGGAFQEKFYPKFDTQKEIYDAILQDLEEVSKRLVELTDKKQISALTQSLFGVSDILNGGDTEKWIRFANSLRLRMALRLVNVEPDRSKSLVTSLIQENRLITEAKYDVMFVEKDQNPTVVSQDLFFRGFEEMGHVLIAPQFILENIFHADATDKNKIDPRMYVIFQPNKEGDYVGLSTKMDDMTYYRKYWKEAEYPDAKFKARIDSIENNKDRTAQAGQIQPNDGSGSAWHTGRLIARYNRATFLNYEMAFPVFNSNEVNLIIAEANVRWGIGTDAATKVAEAMEASTRFYYNLNVNNKYNQFSSPQALYIPKGAKMTELDETQLSAYLSGVKTEFNSLDKKNKYKFIFRQKYIHNNILNPYESYNDARRIIKDLDNEIPITIMCNYYWWERLHYPDSEAKNNSVNFEKVAAKNKVSLPVWWSGRTKATINPNSTGGLILETDR